MHREDLTVYTSEQVHPVLVGLLAEEGVLVVLVAYLFLCYDFGGALRFLFVAALKQDRVHLGAQADNLRDWFSAALVLHLADDLLVLLAVEGMVLGVVAHVVELEVAPHVFVDILRLDLEEERVRVRVEQLAASSVLLLEVLVVELVHQEFGEFEDAHAHVDRFVHQNAFFVHLDSCKAFSKYCCSCKEQAG